MTMLDAVLPEYDWHEVHAVKVSSTPARALAAVLGLPVAPDPIVRLLFRLRGLGRGPTIGEAFESMGFETVARTDTEIVAVAAGKPWCSGAMRPFAEPGAGAVRMAIDFRAEPVATGCRLSTETRIAAVDDAGRRAFRRYWRVVGPFSALIRRRWLAGAKRALR